MLQYKISQMKYFDNFRENYKITCAMHTNLDYFTLFKVNTQTHNLACENLDHLVRIRKKSKELKVGSKWRKQHCTSHLSHTSSVFNSKWRILWSKSDAPKKMKTIRSKGPLYHFKYKGRKISRSAPLTYRVGKERKKRSFLGLGYCIRGSRSSLRTLNIEHI